MLVQFEGISRPIELVGCAHLQGCLADVLPGWRFAEAASKAEPVIRILHRDDGYRLESPWLAEPFHDDTDVGTVCALVLDLIAAYVAERPSLFCLHCAAVELAGRLVVFPSSYHGGKSTLVARLAAAGVPVYTDDVLAVTNAGDRGVALGVAPRLRLPLPRGAGRPFRAFVARHRGRSNRRYLYLNLPPGTLAPHGRQTPIGGFVLLDRQPNGPAELVPATRGQVLQRVIVQHFARSVAATEIVDRLRGVVEQVPCFSLRFARLDDAAALLQDRFTAWPLVVHEEKVPARERGIVPWQGAGAGGIRPRSGDTAGGPHFQQNPAVALHAVDDDLFLVDPRDQSIYHLNLVGAGLWRLLGEPSTAAQAIAVLRAAFPSADPERIEGDVTALLRDLLANDLIVAHDAGGAAGPCRPGASRVAGG
jgi:hypothetical protein